MVSIFYYFLLLADVVWTPFDKVPIVFFGLIGLIYLGTYRKFRVSLVEFFFIAFCVSILFTAASVGFDGNTLQYLFLSILQIGLISFIVTKQRADEEFFTTSVTSFINWSIVCGVLGIIDYLLFEVGITSVIRDYTYSNKVDSIYGTPNVFGIMSAFALIFLLRQGGFIARGLWHYMKIAILLTSVLISSSGMAIGLLLLYFLLGKLTARKIFGVFALLILGVSLFEIYFGILNIPFQVILNKRFELWEAAFEMWSQSKVLGIGTGNFQLTNLVSFEADITGQAFGLHSMYMWLIVETGIVGLILFAAMLWSIVSKIKRHSNKYEFTFLILLLVSQLTETFLQNDELFMMLFWLLAMSFGRNSAIFKRQPHLNSP